MTPGKRFYEARHLLAEKYHHYGYRIVGPFERWLARRRQMALCGTYVGITGSCGKSTTAKLVAAALSARGSVHRGRLANTERSVLRTLRKLDAPTDYVVQEISGGGGPGYLERLTRTIRIDVGIITTVGKEHRAAFPDIDSIAAEKSRVVRSVPAGGLSILNADDPLVRAMAEVAGGRVILYGRAADAEVRAEDVEARWPRRLAFTLVIGERRWPVATRFAGTLMLPNVLAAMAVVHGLGLAVEPALAAIGEVEPVYGHMSLHDGADGHTYLLDTVKAPLWSTILLVDDLENIATDRTVMIFSQISDGYGSESKWYRKLMRKAASHAGLVIALGIAAERARPLIEREGITNIVCAEDVGAVHRLLAELPPSLIIAKSTKVAKLSRLYLATQAPISCLRVRCHLGHGCEECRLLRA
jgi:UDP-N-acetylmuramoyl-tripeptide--D-alanyl-D-alanine ligase